jgi:hypothetical protein
MHSRSVPSREKAEPADAGDDEMLACSHRRHCAMFGASSVVNSFPHFKHFIAPDPFRWPLQRDRLMGRKPFVCFAPLFSQPVSLHAP